MTKLEKIITILETYKEIYKDEREYITNQIKKIEDFALSVKDTLDFHIKKTDRPTEQELINIREIVINTLWDDNYWALENGDDNDIIWVLDLGFSKIDEWDGKKEIMDEIFKEINSLSNNIGWMDADNIYHLIRTIFNKVLGLKEEEDNE